MKTDNAHCFLLNNSKSELKYSSSAYKSFEWEWASDVLQF